MCSMRSFIAARMLLIATVSPPSFTSALACSADARVEVLPGTPVSTLTLGDPSLLVPGVILTVALTRQAGSDQAASGVIVEMPQSSP